MIVIKKYTAIKLSTDKVNDTVNCRLTYGEIEGPYYSQDHPKEEFDTEEEAIKYSYKKNKYSTWLILPIIRFDNIR